MAELVFEGLLGVDANTISAAEKTHSLVCAKNDAGPDGRIAVQMDDLKQNYNVLKPLLQKLAGKQPTSLNYATAMHKLDKAPNKTFETCPAVADVSEGCTIWCDKLLLAGFRSYSFHSCTSDLTRLATYLTHWAIFGYIGPPKCDNVSKVLHEASEFKLSGDKHATEAHLTSWCMFQGQLAHDLVAYCHKLRRHSENSICKYVLDLKALCPAPSAASTRKRKSPSALAEDHHFSARLRC
jgi:hypothetical protein